MLHAGEFQQQLLVVVEKKRTVKYEDVQIVSSYKQLHGRRSPSPPLQPHWERFHRKRYHHVCLHNTLSPLFPRLTGIHDRLNYPVPQKKREETDDFHSRELAPEACARTWPEASLVILITGSNQDAPILNAVSSSDSAVTPCHRLGSYLHGSGK